jgi:hypothetical protein
MGKGAAGFATPLLSTVSSGAEGDRTPDLLTASQALSQLSYSPGRSERGQVLQRFSELVSYYFSVFFRYRT